jgi:hypothetical protein
MAGATDLTSVGPALSQDEGWADVGAAQYGIPYAQIANDVYADQSSGPIGAACNGKPCVYTRVADWADLFRANPVFATQVGAVASSGFYAAIYENNVTHQIVLAYRGTIASNAEDLKTDAYAIAGIVPDQYKYAVTFAILAEAKYKGVTITSVGDSKGGGQAIYAAQQTSGISNIVTTSPARPSFLNSINRPGVSETNYVVPGEFIGDCKTGAFGGCPPGKTYSVRSTTDQQPNCPLCPPVVTDAINTYHDVTGTHKIAGIIGGLQKIAGITPQATASQTPTAPRATTAPFGVNGPPSTLQGQPGVWHPVPNVGSNSSKITTVGPQQPTFSYRQPGGISLTSAAAERMPLNLSLEGAFYHDNRIVLAGPKNSASTIDAALFLTALRAACTGSDPYFSLDPDDISAWLAQTEEANKELMASIHNDLQWHFRNPSRKSPSILNFRTILASRDYPTLWTSLLARYPALYSRLVFKPEWLRETRFGEILYKADVLLKEFAGGAPTLGTSTFRASSIRGYVSATDRMAAQRLLFQYHNVPQQEVSVAGGRIWYDLTETSDVLPQVQMPPEFLVPVKSELRSLLQTRGLLGQPTAQPVRAVLSENEGTLDLTSIYPRMYVRTRDPITHRDGTGNFPGLNELTAEANQHPERYAAAYREYQALVDVFRAYVVAVKAKRWYPGLCQGVPRELLDAEKVSSALPVYHPTELSLTVAWYEETNGRVRRATPGIGGLFQGGVSVGATRFLNEFSEPSAETPIIQKIKAVVAKLDAEPTWADSSGWQFITFTAGDPPEVASLEPAPSITLKPGEGYGPPVVQEAPTAAPRLPNYSGFPSTWPAAQGDIKLSQVLPAQNQASRSNARDFTGSSAPLLIGIGVIGAFILIIFRRQLVSAHRVQSTARREPTHAPSQAFRPESEDELRREFNLVFSDRNKIDKERIISEFLKERRYTRAEAMRDAIAAWRKAHGVHRN